MPVKIGTLPLSEGTWQACMPTWISDRAGVLNPDVPLTDIPDVDKGTPHHQEILTLYRMGVAVGDEWMRFNPDGYIRRNEAVALAIRLLYDDSKVELPKG